MKQEEQIFAYKELRNNGQSFFIDNYEDADRVIEALEKNIPKKPILKERQSLVHVNKGNQPHEWINEKYKDWCCPVCDFGVGEQYVPRNHNQRKMYYCWKCGQKIDWEV